MIVLDPHSVELWGLAAQTKYHNTEQPATLDRNWNEIFF